MRSDFSSKYCSMLISDSRFDLVWFRLSCDHGWIRSGSVNVRKQHLYILYHPFIIPGIHYVATFTTVSIISKRLITLVVIMLPPCSSSLVSSSHSYDETITNIHPRNDALALLSPPCVVLQKGGRGNAVAKARCLSLVHASAKNRGHSLHEGGGRLNQGDV